MTQPPDRSSAGSTARVVVGAAIIAGGALWLADALGVEVRWEVLLPIALIVVGIAMLALARRGGSTPLLITGVALSLALVLGVPGGLGLGSTETESRQFTEQISRIEVSSPSGSTSISAGGETVQLERTLTFGDNRPEITEQVVDGVLRIEVRCEGDFIFGGCNVDHRITAPSSVALLIETGSGGVDVTGILGGTTVNTGSGSVDLDGVAGDLLVETGSGGISGSELAGRTLIASTGSGGVDLGFETAPFRVEVTTGSGGIEIVVPEGAYAVDIDSSSGSEEVEGITQDPTAERSIVADSGSGSISISSG